MHLVKYFLEQKMNPDIRDNFGYAASYWATQREHLDCAKLLGPPLKRSKEEYYDHMKLVWGTIGFAPGKKKKKGKGKGKKKK